MVGTKWDFVSKWPLSCGFRELAVKQPSIKLAICWWRTKFYFNSPWLECSLWHVNRNILLHCHVPWVASRTFYWFDSYVPDRTFVFTAAHINFGVLKASLAFYFYASILWFIFILLRNRICNFTVMMISFVSNSEEHLPLNQTCQSLDWRKSSMHLSFSNFST